MQKKTKVDNRVRCDKCHSRYTYNNQKRRLRHESGACVPRTGVAKVKE